MNDAMLIHGLKQFGMVTVEWPSARQPGVPAPKGYAYVIFESEKQVSCVLLLDMLYSATLQISINILFPLGQSITTSLLQ